MQNAGATTPLGHIRDRRREPHAERTFERRSAGGEDVRVIRKFEGMGAEKVEAILSEGGFGIKSRTAKRWLNGQQGSRKGGRGLKLMLAVAIGSIGGTLLFFAL